MHVGIPRHSLPFYLLFSKPFLLTFQTPVCTPSCPQYNIFVFSHTNSFLRPYTINPLPTANSSPPTVPNIPCCLDYFLPPIHTVRPQEFSFGLALCLTISPFRLHVSFPNDFSMGRSGTSVACGSILCSAKCIHTKARTSADMAPESHSSPFRMLHPQSLAQQFRMSRIVSFASPHLPSLYSTPMRLAVRAPSRARIVGVEFRRH